MNFDECQTFLLGQGYQPGDTKKEFGEKEWALMSGVLFLVKNHKYVTVVYYKDKFLEAHVDQYDREKNYKKSPVGMKYEDLVKNGFIYSSYKLCRSLKMFKESL